MPAILFVCTANLYRSALAAAFLRSEVENTPGAATDWEIDSAGTWTKNGIEIHPKAIEDADHFGLDVRTHRSKQVSAELLSKQDLILVMETGHKEALMIEFPEQSNKIQLLSEVVDGRKYNIPDPFSQDGKNKREVADELHRIITRGYEKIILLAKKNSNYQK